MKLCIPTSVYCCILILNFCIQHNFGENDKKDLLMTRSSRETKIHIRPDALNVYLHQTAMIALLKARADHCLGQMAAAAGEFYSERILYRECAREAKSPHQLAKCVSALLRAKDQQRQMEEGNVRAENVLATAPEQGPTDLFSRLLSMLSSFTANFSPLAGTTKPIPTASSSRKPIRRQRKQQQAIWRRHWEEENLVPKRDEDNEQQKYSGRTRRNSEIPIEKQQSQKSLPNVEKFKRIQQYYKQAEYCSERLARLDKLNSKILKSEQNSISLQSEPIGDLNKFLLEAEQIARSIGFDKFSVLSPHIFPLFGADGPKKNGRDTKLRDLASLSPTLFSFSREGFLSLPAFFQFLNVGPSESLEWLELMLEMTGAAQKLDSVLAKLEPKMADLEANLLPAVKAMETEECNWLRMKRSLSDRQRQEIDARGYTFLNSRQRRLAYARRPTVPDFARMASNGRQLDAKIHQLAALQLNQQPTTVWESDQLRKKRQSDQQPLPSSQFGQTQFGHLQLLQPMAFSNQFGLGAVMEGILLSPYFWATELLSPEVGQLELLSPHAFMASILTSTVLAARILSPSAFDAQILTAEIGSVYVLSPEFLFTEVLAPEVGNPRILSSQVMSISILAPNIVQPRVGTMDMLSIAVLSPNVLSPRFNSSEKFMLEILSPHILGGAHMTSSEESKEEEEQDQEAGHEVHGGGHQPADTNIAEVTPAPAAGNRGQYGDSDGGDGIGTNVLDSSGHAEHEKEHEEHGRRRKRRRRR